MGKAEWINYKGKKIMTVVLSGLPYDQIVKVIEQAKPLIAKEAPNSVLCYTDTTGTPFTTEVSNLMKEFTAHNKPYIKMSAVVGVEGLQKVAFNGVLLFTGRRNLVLKNTREEALDWLAAQQ